MSNELTGPPSGRRIAAQQKTVRSALKNTVSPRSALLLQRKLRRHWLDLAIRPQRSYL